MCWRRARERTAMPSAWTAKRCRLRGGPREGVPVFKRTRTCADLVGQQSAGLMGVQFGRLAGRAAMRQRFMV